MPFSFICIAILLLFSIVLRYYYGLNIKPYAFVCIMAIILISYFVPSVNIFNNISLNILCVASLISYIVISMFNMNLKEVGKQAVGCVLCVSAYILILKAFDGYMFAYLDVVQCIVASIISVFYYKRSKSYVLSIITDITAINITNIVLLNNEYGYASIFQIDCYSNILISILVVFVYSLIIKLISKIKNRNNSEELEKKYANK